MGSCSGGSNGTGRGLVKGVIYLRSRSDVLHLESMSSSQRRELSWFHPTCVMQRHRLLIPDGTSGHCPRWAQPGGYQHLALPYLLFGNYSHVHGLCLLLACLAMVPLQTIRPLMGTLNPKFGGTCTQTPMLRDPFIPKPCSPRVPGSQTARRLLRDIRSLEHGTAIPAYPKPQQAYTTLQAPEYFD